jgi:hypothetical protein
MHCRTCDYELWNLRARECPECGTAFKPSEYEFVPNTVQFCCPHCAQGYYGTDEKGLLEPREFDCAQCGSRVHIDEMVLVPAEGVRERDTRYQRPPWADSLHRSIVMRWILTVWGALVAPHRMLDGPRGPGGAGRAWGFAAVTALIVSAVTLLPFFAFFGLMALGFGGPVGFGGVAMFTLVFAGTALASAVITLALAGLWGLAAHALLRLTGTTPHGLGRTCEAICYSSGANVATAVPCIGHYFGWIWWLVSAVLMIRSAQHVSRTRAAVAGILFPVVGTMVVVAAYVGLVAMASTTTTPMPPVLTGQAEAATAVRSIKRTAQQYAAVNGEWPPHAALLISDSYADPMTFIILDSDTAPDGVSVGTVPLSQLVAEPVAAQREAAMAAAASLPQNVVAHRLGDFVFCWHGIPQRRGRDTDVRLWLIIAWPDPEQNAPPAADDEIVIVTTAAVTARIKHRDFAIELANQNAVRAQHGLPPLPDPADVLHGWPAIADE